MLKISRTRYIKDSEWNPNNNFLFTYEKFTDAKSRDLLPFKCLRCGKIFYKSKKDIQNMLNPNSDKIYKHCTKCINKPSMTKIICMECGKKLIRISSQITKNTFCSTNCAAKYNGKQKTKQRIIDNWNPNNNFLFTYEEFLNSSNDKLLPIKCLCCGEIFYKIKEKITSMFYKNSNTIYKYCNKNSCHNKEKRYISELNLECPVCHKKFHRCNHDIKTNRKNFCSRNCKAIYYARHKDFGYSRSALEEYIEKQLTHLYPSLEIKYNSIYKEFELDIYIPLLQLAFEINGIFHYKPIFGNEKLERTQKIDKLKLQICEENNINLISLDTSNLKSFRRIPDIKKLELAKPYLKIIIDEIKKLCK